MADFSSECHPVDCYVFRLLLWHQTLSSADCLFNSELELLKVSVLIFPLQARDGHATYLRFIIMSAFDHFASVHSISAEGTALSNLS